MTFQSFDPARLQQFYEKFPLSPEGRIFVERALAAPSRNVAGTPYNVVSDIPCPKMFSNMQSESHSVEHKFMLMHIFDSNVLGYVNQPPSFEISYIGKNARKIRSRYTPDFLVLDLKKGFVVEESKPHTDRFTLCEKHIGKYVRDEDGAVTSKAISSVLSPWGIDFKVRFSDEISERGHLNRKFLLDYLYPAASKHFRSRLPDLLVRFSGSPVRTFGELAETPDESDVLMWALATGGLYFDFESELLAGNLKNVNIFQAIETLNAWKSAVRADGSRPLRPDQCSPRELATGDRIEVDGIFLTITFCGESRICAADAKGKSVIFSHLELSEFVKSGNATLPSQRHHTPSKVWSASPNDLVKAIKRIETVKKIDACSRGAGRLKNAKEHGISTATAYRWKNSIRLAVQAGLSEVEGAISSESDRGYRGSHIDDETSQMIDDQIVIGLSDKKNLSTLSLFSEIESCLTNAGRKMIAKSSFYARVKKLRTITTIYRSQGHKAAYQKAASFWMLEMATPVHCERALELVHLDSTLLDVQLRSSLSGDIIGRPWLSIAICATTRKVVGQYLSFTSPGEISTMMLLAEVIRTTGRLPDNIIHDWGSEFKGAQWKSTLTALTIGRHTRPKSAPRFGAIIERNFGKVTSSLIQNIAGNTKARKNVRMMSPSCAPDSHDGLTLLELSEGLRDFFNVQNDTKHATTLRRPNEYFNTSLLVDGPRYHRQANFDDLLPLLMPTSKCPTRLIDPARGLFCNYRYYGHPKLLSLGLKGTKITVKPLPYDPSAILAFLDGAWVRCSAGVAEDLRIAPEIVRRCAYEEWLSEKGLVRTSSDKARRAIHGIGKGLNKKAEENRAYWKQSEGSRDSASSVSMTSENQSTTSGKALTSLESLFSQHLQTLSTDKESGQDRHESAA